MSAAMRWTPAAVLGAGVALLALGAHGQRRMPLRASLATSVPTALAGSRGTDRTVSEEERRVAGMSDYLLRGYASPAGGDAFSVYVGYYESQARGRTIHSPKNCLPGGGWQVLQSRPVRIATAAGPVTANRYLLKRGAEQALVLYWYQGRGRVEANEYRVKWDLLRDSALRGRSDEALVRVMVPVRAGEDDAFRLAERVSRELVPALQTALPT